MAQWPYDAEVGIYELTVNADKLGSIIVDTGSNPASKQAVLVKIGCSGDNEAYLDSGPSTSRLSSSSSLKKTSHLGDKDESHNFSLAQLGIHGNYFNSSLLQKIKFRDSLTLRIGAVITAAVILTVAVFSVHERRNTDVNESHVLLAKDSEVQKRSQARSNFAHKGPKTASFLKEYGAVI